MSHRVIHHATVEGLLTEAVGLVLDGWNLSKTEPAEALPFGSGFIAYMERTDATVAAFKAHADAMQAAPKLTPAERMAKARAARGKGRLDTSTIVQN